jgi:hypothetical protein
MSGPSPAYQIYESRQNLLSTVLGSGSGGSSSGAEQSVECFRLSRSAYNASNVRVGLYDESQPARGVYLRYTHGNTCDADTVDASSSAAVAAVASAAAAASSGTGSSVETNKRLCNAVAVAEQGGAEHCTRSLQVNVLCSNTEREVPEVAAVEQLHPCAYRITIESVAGCPLECPIDPTSLAVCADHGVCGHVKGETACLCERGWFGEDCSFQSAAAAAKASGSYRGVGSATSTDAYGNGNYGAMGRNSALWWLVACTFLAGVAVALRWRRGRRNGDVGDDSDGFGTGRWRFPARSWDRKDELTSAYEGGTTFVAQAVHAGGVASTDLGASDEVELLEKDEGDNW